MFLYGDLRQNANAFLLIKMEGNSKFWGSRLQELLAMVTLLLTKKNLFIASSFIARSHNTLEIIEVLLRCSQVSRNESIVVQNFPNFSKHVKTET